MDTHDETTARPTYVECRTAVALKRLTRVELETMIAAIWHTLTGVEWSMDECDSIAETLKSNGFPILDPNEVTDE